MFHSLVRPLESPELYLKDFSVPLKHVEDSLFSLKEEQQHTLNKPAEPLKH